MPSYSPPGGPGHLMGADQLAWRNGLFVKPPAPIPEEEKKRIIAAYNEEYKHVPGLQHTVRDVVSPPYEDRKAWLEYNTTRWDLGMAGTRNNRAPALEEEVRQTIERMEKTGPVSEDTKAAIFLHHTRNDGYTERLREWASGREEVPVEAYNRLLQTLEALRYDAVTEDARLRSKMRAAEARPSMYDEGMRRRLAHATALGKADTSRETFRREMRRFERAAADLDRRTFLRHGRKANDGEEEKEEEKEEEERQDDGSVSTFDSEVTIEPARAEPQIEPGTEPKFEPAKMSIKEIIDKIISRITAIQSMEEVARQLDPEDPQTQDHESKLRCLYERAGDELSTLHNESHIRFSDFLTAADRGRTLDDKLRRHELYKTFDDRRKALMRHYARFKAAGKHLRDIRILANTAVREHLEIQRQPMPQVHRSQMAADLVSFKDMTEERVRSMKLSRRLNEAKHRLRTLEKMKLQGRPGTRDQHNTIRAYRGLVAKSLITNVIDDKKLVERQSERLDSVMVDFDIVKGFLDVVQLIPNPEGTPDTRRIDLLEALERIKRVMESTSSSFTEMHQSLEEAVAELKEGKDGVGGKKWAQAEELATMQAKDDEISRLRQEADRLKKSAVPISDTSGVQAVLRAADLERDRARDLDAQLEKSQERVRTLEEAAALSTKHIEQLIDDMKEKDVLLAATEVPKDELIEELGKMRVGLRMAEDRAGEHEARKDKLQEELSASKALILNYQMLELKRSDPDAAEAVAELEDKIRAAQDGDEVDRLREQVETLQSTLQSREKQLRHVQENVRQIIGKAENAIKRQFEKRRQKYKDDLKRLRDVVEQHKEELENVREQNRILKDKLKLAEKGLFVADNTEDQIIHLHEEKTDSVAQEAAGLQARLETALQAYKERDGDYRDLRRDNASLEKLCEQFKTRAEDAIRRCADAEDLNERLMEEMGVLRQEYAHAMARKPFSRRQSSWALLRDELGEGNRFERRGPSSTVRRLVDRAKEKLKKVRKGPRPAYRHTCMGMIDKRDCDKNNNGPADDPADDPANGEPPMCDGNPPRDDTMISTDDWLAHGLFQKDRSGVIQCLSDRQLSLARQRLDALERWMAGVGEAYSWEDSTDWMDTMGSLHFLGALVAAEEAWAARLAGDDWEEAVRRAQKALSKALREYRAEKRRRAAAAARSPDSPERDASADVRWLQIGRKAGKLTMRARNPGSSGVPECGCAYMIVPCALHTVTNHDEGDGDAGERTERSKGEEWEGGEYWDEDGRNQDDEVPGDEEREPSVEDLEEELTELYAALKEPVDELERELVGLHAELDEPAEATDELGVGYIGDDVILLP